MFLGRTIGIHEDDFSTPLLDIPPVCVCTSLKADGAPDHRRAIQDDLEKVWQPCPPDPLCSRFTPIPAMYVSYFRYLSSLCKPRCSSPQCKPS